MRRRRLPPATHGTGALPQPHAQGRAAPACPALRFPPCRDRGSGRDLSLSSYRTGSRGTCSFRRFEEVHAGPVPSVVPGQSRAGLPPAFRRAVREPPGRGAPSLPRAAEQARRYRSEPGHRSAAAAASPLGPECDCGHGLPEENVLCSNIRRSRTARRDAACRRAGGVRRKGASAAFSPECGIGSSLVPRTFFNACCRS